MVLNIIQNKHEFKITTSAGQPVIESTSTTICRYIDYLRKYPCIYNSCSDKEKKRLKENGY